MDAPVQITADGNIHRNLDDVRLITLRDTATDEAYGMETYRLLEQAIMEITYENENTFTDDESKLQRAERYTGLHRNVIQTLLTRQNSLQIPNGNDRIRRVIIHYTLYDYYYLRKRLIPTSTCIFNKIQKHLPLNVDIRSFRSELVQMGYIFKRTDLNTAVVMENPTVRFDRFKYLKKIQEFRKQGKPIYYVCEAALQNLKIIPLDECESQQQNNWQDILLYVVSKSSVTCPDKPLTNLESYINALLTGLVSGNTGGVVILNNTKRLSEKFCETPNENSLKCDMIEWLEYHQIPFSEKMTRVDLWTLIETTTNIHANMYKMDNLIKTLGLEVLRIPDCINNLTPESFVNNLLEKEVVLHNISLKQLMQVVKVEGLLSINSFIAAEEEKLLELEIKIDAILDELQASAVIEGDQTLPCLAMD